MNHSDFHTMGFTRKAFFIYAINSVSACVGVAASTICDAIIVGHAFGELGLAITSVVMPIYMFYNFISYSISVGGCAAVSLRFGRDDHQGAQALFSQSISLALFSSAVLALLGVLALPVLVQLLGGASLGTPCLGYVAPVVAGAPFFIVAPVLSMMLRADGEPGRSTAGIVLSSAVNLILDVVFVLILKLGIQGAAWAMVMGQACAVAVYLPHFFSKRFALRLRLCRFSLRQGAELCMGGMGTASYYAWQFLYICVFNNILSVTAGQQGLAVFNLVFNVSMLAYSIFDGISLAIPTLAATYLGERDHRSLAYTVRLSLKTALVCALALACLLLLFSGNVAVFFGIKDPLTLTMGTQAVRIYCAAMICSCLSGTLCACYQSLGHTKLALTIQFLRGCLFLLGVGVPLLWVFGGKGVSLALVTAECLGLAAALVLAGCSRRKLHTDDLLLLPRAFEQAAVYEDMLDRDFQRLPEIVSAVEAFCEENLIDPATAYSIQLTIEELAANIIQFGFRDHKPHFIAFKIAKYDTDIYVRIRDDATDYNPLEKRGDIGAGQANMDLLGVELVQKKAKDFLYQRRLVFNNLLIIL